MSSRECCGPSYGTEVLEGVDQKSVRTIALVGPPNCGKTTLFNQLTGLNRKVANFPGVTVEHFTGYLTLQDGERVALIDLPGIYSLNAKSEDERVTVDVLRGQMTGIERPDAIVLVVDSTNLGRHLALAAPVISLGLPTLVLLNMADSLRARERPYRCAIAGEAVRHSRSSRQRGQRRGLGRRRSLHQFGHAPAATG